MNLRKTILLSAPVILLLGAAWLGFKIWDTIQRQAKIKTTNQNLPSIPLRTTDGTLLVTDSFKNGAGLLVLNYFNPDCDHCQNMVQELFRETSLLQNVHWLMISSHTPEKTRRFADSLNLSQLPNVTVLTDTASLFAQTFGTVSVPSFYVYQAGKLIRKHSGECSIAYLLQQ